MADISSNNIRIGANISGLLDGMKQASNAVRGMTLDMNSKLTDAYRRAAKEQKVFSGGLEKLGNDIQSLAGKMAMFGSLPALFAAGKAYKDFAELQKLEKGLKRYGESLEDVRQLAKLPNIGVFDGAKTLIGLRAVGVESEKSKRLIRSFANAIAEAGGEALDLDPALTNIKQFLSTGSINQVDIKQLAARVPQINKILQDAFGTTSAPDLNKIGVGKVVDEILKGLEKIPPVAGGATAAMDQLGDSVTFFSGTLGEGIDKAFDITGKIGQLGDMLDGLSSSFRGLTPEAQKSIVSLGAVAVALPLVMGAVGGLIKLLPILATGFGLISAPVAGVVAVVALAAATIISNWDSVKNFLTESTWWNTLVGIGKSFLGMLMETFKVVINLIQGDWGNLGRALVNILKNAGNLVINVLAGIVKGVLGLFGTLNEALGFEALGKGISTAVNYIDGLAKKFQFDVPDSVGAASAAISKVKESITGATSPTKELTGAATELGEAMKYVSENAKEMARIDRLMESEKEKGALKAKIKEYKELFGVVSGLNTELQKPIGSTIGGPLSKSQDRSKDLLNGSIGKIGVGNASIDAKLKEDLKAYEESAGSITELNRVIQESFQQMKVSVAETMAEGIGDAFSGMDFSLENVGKAIFGIFGDLLSKIGKALITWAVTIKAAKTAMKSMQWPVALAAGVVAIAAGKALKNNVAGMGSKAATRFAKAGMAYREMNAIVGDNQNARFDPEMIAPYSRIDQSIKKSVSEVGGGGGVIIPEVRLRGQDLIVAFKRAEKSNKGYGRGG